MTGENPCRGIKVDHTDDSGLVRASVMFLCKGNLTTHKTYAESLAYYTNSSESFADVLCLMDLNLEDGKTGVDLVKEIRKYKPDAFRAIVFVTASNDSDLLEEAQELGTVVDKMALREEEGFQKYICSLCRGCSV